MSLIKSNSVIRFLVIPLALCAVMFNARCKDDDNDEFIEQALLNLASCPGGTMGFTLDGNPRAWTCCVAVNHGTYWEVVGRGGNEVIRLFIGDAVPANSPFDASTLASHEYILLVAGGVSYYGVSDSPYNSGTSSITVTTNDADSITGTFSGDVYRNDGITFRAITLGTFTALK